MVPDVEKYAPLITALENALRELNIRSSNGRVTKQVPHVNVLLSPGLVVCLDRESGTEDREMSSFLNDPRIRRKRIIKILVSVSEDGAALDPFPEIEALAKFDFTSPGRYELEEFKNFVREITG
jgi:hypothetical protein